MHGTAQVIQTEAGSRYLLLVCVLSLVASRGSQAEFSGPLSAGQHALFGSGAASGDDDGYVSAMF